MLVYKEFEFFEFCLSWVVLDSSTFSELARSPQWSLELGTPTKIHYMVLRTGYSFYSEV